MIVENCLWIMWVQLRKVHEIRVETVDKPVRNVDMLHNIDIILL